MSEKSNKSLWFSELLLCKKHRTWLQRSFEKELREWVIEQVTKSKQHRYALWFFIEVKMRHWRFFSSRFSISMESSHSVQLEELSFSALSSLPPSEILLSSKLMCVDFFRLTLHNKQVSAFFSSFPTLEVKSFWLEIYLNQ